jgi:putative endonuclease
MILWKDYYTYIVQCSDGSYYTGVTNCIERRVNQHNTGLNTKCYTYRRRPVQLKYTAHFHDIWVAIAHEKRLKRWSRKKKEALIKQDWKNLWALAECKNTSHRKIDIARKQIKHCISLRLRSD